jgi:glycosyltransferase involved in cell wall biosynthesis
MFVVLDKDEIHYETFKELNIPYTISNLNLPKKDLRQFIYYSKLIRSIKPDIIHTWTGSTFYALPIKMMHNIPLLSSIINDSNPKLRKYSLKWIKIRTIIRLSDLVLANSLAGRNAYDLNDKNCRVIYNGVDMKRFKNLPSKNMIKKEYNITTQYVVIMVASYSIHKKYDLFVKIAIEVNKTCNDITFIGVGGTEQGAEDIYTRAKMLAGGHERILLLGKIWDVESLIKASNIGLLCTHGEGLSNAIIEYMALGKPAIANDLGGVNEIIQDDVNGYMLKNDNAVEYAQIIISLINNPKKRNKMGVAGKSLVKTLFSVEKMGRQYENVYASLLKSREK